jgi:hypothetical protein
MSALHLEGFLDPRASITLGFEPDVVSVFEDGAFWCRCGAQDPDAHKSECRLSPEHREAALAAHRALGASADIDAAAKAARSCLEGRSGR